VTFISHVHSDRRIDDLLQTTFSDIAHMCEKWSKGTRWSSLIWTSARGWPFL